MGHILRHGVFLGLISEGTVDGKKPRTTKRGMEIAANQSAGRTAAQAEYSKISHKFTIKYAQCFLQKYLLKKSERIF